MLYGAPQINFYAYNMGAPHTCFFAYYKGAPSDLVFRLLYGKPPSDQFLRILFRGCLRLVSPISIGGPSDQFLCILYGELSDQLLHVLYEGPLRPVSSLTIWGSPDRFFVIHFLRVKLSLGCLHIFDFPGGGGASAGAHVYTLNRIAIYMFNYNECIHYIYKISFTKYTLYVYVA